MKYSSIVNLSVVGFVAMVFFGYGVAVCLYQIFPYKQMREVKHLYFPDSKESLVRNREYRVSFFEEFSSKADVVFIGDSLTERGEWSEFFPGLYVANRGVGGDKSSDVLRRIESIISTQPEYAFIAMGINDIYRHVPTEEIFINYRNLVQALKAEGIKVVIQSTIQCEKTKCFDQHEKVNDLNRRLREYAAQNDIAFIDLGILSDSEGLDATYTYDGTHLNGKGYREWVHGIAPTIESFGNNHD